MPTPVAIPPERPDRESDERAWVYDPDDQPVLHVPAGGDGAIGILVKSLRDCAQRGGR
jgi:hypothetical protein